VGLRGGGRFAAFALSLQARRLAAGAKGTQTRSLRAQRSLTPLFGGLPKIGDAAGYKPAGRTGHRPVFLVAEESLAYFSR
jgi:hypothetical protein